MMRLVAYYDANGEPLRGPCLGHRRCNLMSGPGGAMHEGPCMKSYADPHLGYHTIPKSKRCTSRCPAAGYLSCEHIRNHPGACEVSGYRWHRGHAHARPLMLSRPEWASR